VLEPWAKLQGMLQGILQGAGPIGYCYKVLTGVLALVFGRFVPGYFVLGSSFLDPHFGRFVVGHFIAGSSFLGVSWVFYSSFLAFCSCS
jgi:hypothetical protein